VLERCKKFRLRFTFTFYDRYNWDVGSVAEVMGEEVPDNELGRLHKIGWAREFDMIGSITRVVEWHEGERFNASGQSPLIERR
jgi:hypothetical protein